VADLDVAVTLSGRDNGLSSATSAAAESLKKLQEAADQSTGIMDRLWGSIQQGIGMAAGFRIFEMVGSLLGGAAESAIGFNQKIDAASSAMGKFFDSQESVTNSLKNLQDLANKTPFAFEGMVTAQQRTIGAARSAEELKQNMDAITVVAANTGRVSTANMDRISLALGQVQAKGHLAGGEMLQLTEAGVNMGEILAAHFGVSTAAIIKMTEQGKISSQDVFAAMREYAADPRNRQALDGLAKTFEGAMSTIKDVMESTTAAAFRPFFDLLTEGANALADFLQSEQFKVWAEAVRLGLVAASGALHGLLDTLAPLGQAIATAFGQLTSGDFAGAFSTLTAGFTTQLQSIWDGITAFASNMLGAGENVVGQFAQGIIDGAAGVLQGAIDVVANLIASFLVGNSPPPTGPLSQIDTAGTKLMETYGQGMQQGLGPAKVAVQSLTDQIRDIDRSISDIDYSNSGYKNDLDDIKRAYEDQIRPLNDQLRIIKEKADAGKAEAELAFKMQDIALKQAELDAKGDPVKRAEIAQRLTILKQQEQSLGFEQSLADVERQKAKLADDGNKARLEDLQYTRERATLEKQLADARKPGGGGDTVAIASRLQELDLRHKQSQADREAAAADAKEKQAQLDLRGKEIAAQQELDALTDKGKLAEIAKQKELNDASKSRFEIEQATKDIATAAAQADIKSQIDAAKKAEEERLRPIQDAVTANDRIKQDLEEQKKILGFQKADLQEIVNKYKEAEAAAKKAIPPAAPGAPAGGIHFDLTPVQQEAEERIKESGAHLAQSLSEGASSWLHDNFWTLAIGAIGAVGGAGIGASIGAALFSFIPVFGTAFGALIGGAIGAAIGGLAVADLARMVADKFEQIVGAPLGEVVAETITELRQTFATEGWGGIVLSVLEILADGVRGMASKLAGWALALLDWVQPAARQLMNRLNDVIQGVYGWIESNARPIGDRLYAWSLALVHWAQTGGLDLLSKLADIIGDVLAWIGSQTSVLAGKLLDWATAFVAWVGPKIPELLTELGKLVSAAVVWMGTHLGELLDALGKWAVEFVAWVGPKIPPLLVELGKLLVALTDWTITTALPAIGEKLLEWGKAIVEWVGPRIGPLLLELGKVLLAITEWVFLTALPAIVEQLATWGLAFIEWIAPKIPELLLELGKLLLAITTWIITDGVPSLVGKLVEWGGAFLGWIAAEVIPHLAEKLGAILVELGSWVTSKVTDVENVLGPIGQHVVEGIRIGIANALDDFWGWLKANFIDKIPESIRNILHLEADTGAMALVGERMVQELEIGIKNRWPTLSELMETLSKQLSGHGSTATGEIADYIRKDAKERGIDPDIAVRVAETEGGVTDPMEVGEFSTGKSFWPFQLHYGGAGTPWESWGDTAGMGNNFTAKTGWQPYDWRAWKASTDWALDEARKYGWGQWYGAAAHGIANGEGIPELAMGGIVRATPGGRLIIAGEGGADEAVTPLPQDWRSGGSSSAGIDSKQLASDIADAIGPVIAATRPINLVGTSEELLDKARRQQRRDAFLRGPRRQ
jgi:tape measure domain-containing protein